MFIRVGRAHPRALRVGLATGASLLAISWFAAAQTLAADPASVTARIHDGTLQIMGTDGADRLALRLEPGNPSTLEVDVADDGTVDFSFARSAFAAINIQGGAGDDEIRVDETQGALTDGAITLDGGPGNDTLTGGSGPDVIDGGLGDDVLRGGDGDDVLVGGPGNDQVDGGRGSDTVSLGSGGDRFTWDPGDGSDTVDGGAGNDTLVFDGSNVGEHMELSADSSHVHLFRDVGDVTMDLSTIETADVNATGGADTITVDDLTGTGLRNTAVDLGGTPGGPGDGQPDTVIVNGTDHADHVHLSSTAGDVLVAGLASQIQIAGAEAADDTLNVNTLAGDDTIDGGAAVSGPAGIAIDGGPGADTANYLGTTGADAIDLAADGTAVRATAPAASPTETAAVENLDIQGLAGDDTITGSNGLAGLATLTIDGGLGDDVLRGGDGDDVLVGGPGNDQVDGGRGSDTVSLGSGGDRFTWDPGDGSDTVDGGAGNDTLVFDGSNVGEHMELSADSSHVHLFRDVGDVTMDLSTIETADVNATGGADTITVDDLTGTGLRTTAVDLGGTPGGPGDGQPDTVIVNGTDHADHVHLSSTAGDVLVAGLASQIQIAGAEAADDTLNVNTLAGDDTVSVASGVFDVILPVIDLGADQ